MTLPPHFKTAWNCKCPKCNVGDLYANRYSITLRPACAACGLDLSKSDSADGPAVFLIFLLGFLIVPAAVIVDFKYTWPFWAHALVWPLLMLFITALLLRPLKAYVIGLQYRHRATDWE